MFPPRTMFEAFQSIQRDAFDYVVDSCQRSVLFWDTMRERGDIHLDQEKNTTPVVLGFDYVTVIDGHDLDPPCNYVLLRIVPSADDRIDESKRPYVIIDPRAGHGPGIGGMKQESQVGVALRAGHAVYFVSFYPEPVPNQRLKHVAEAEAVFIAEVQRRHPNAGKPCVIGNCQAGWAVAALASVHPELLGPIVLNGAPLSYWAGSDEQNPMRYTAGLLGGSWPAAFVADLGHGLFDGAYLVSNFEQLNPANTHWKKAYNLYAKIDTEVPRYLQFERWWGSFFLMTSEEIEAIVNQLFVGNRLADGIPMADGVEINLRNISSPIVVFASRGDNITPPQQALNWIVDVYGHESAIVEDAQTIVYMVHEDVGHLGIFVSGRVAAKEHAEMVNTMDMIEILPPGLYEMMIEQAPDDGSHGDYRVRFEPRTMEDILRFDDGRQDEEVFSTIKQVSKLNYEAYTQHVRPRIRAWTNESTAQWLRAANPMRVQRWMWSGLNPWMLPVAAWADVVRGNRRPAGDENPYRQWERSASKEIEAAWDRFREARDAAVAATVKQVYGPSGFGAFLPPVERDDASQHAALRARLNEKREAMDARFEQGGVDEAAARMLIAVIKRRGGFSRCSYHVALELRRQKPAAQRLPLDRVREILAEQALLLELDHDRAMNALPILLPTRAQREAAVDYVSKVMMLEPELSDPESALARRVKKFLEVETDECYTSQPVPA